MENLVHLVHLVHLAQEVFKDMRDFLVIQDGLDGVVLERVVGLVGLDGLVSQDQVEHLVLLVIRVGLDGVVGQVRVEFLVHLDLVDIQVGLVIRVFPDILAILE